MRLFKITDGCVSYHALAMDGIEALSKFVHYLHTEAGLTWEELNKKRTEVILIDPEKVVAIRFDSDDVKEPIALRAKEWVAIYETHVRNGFMIISCSEW